MERETGIGPATNSLEGCDSTIELLPLINHFWRLLMDRVDAVCAIRFRRHLLSVHVLDHLDL